MKKGIRKIFIYVGLFIIFVLVIFLLGYINKESKLLKNYNINEKLVVTFKEIEGKKFLLNLNTKKFKEYNGNYNIILNNYYDRDIIGKTIKSPFNDYYIIRGSVYLNNKRIYRRGDASKSKYWTQNTKYLISNELYTIKLFGMFFPIKVANFSPTIIELETGKSIQFLLKNENGIELTIEKILGYVID